MDAIKDNLPKSRRDVKHMIDISGPTPEGRTKAHVILRYVEFFSDGTEKELDSVIIEKPIVYVFKHAGFVNVRLDFNSSGDLDLKYIYRILEDYSNPANSVSYLPEEAINGIYNDGEKDRLVYYPFITLALSPIDNESEYQIIGMNPLCYCLQPRDLTSPEPTVIQFTFDEDWFIISDDVEPIDMEALYQEAYQILLEQEVER